MNIFLSLFLLLAVSLNTYAAEPDKVRIALKWFYQYQFAGIVMAKEKGIYKRYGLDVDIIERDPKKNNVLQVAKGEAEYGIADSSILLYRSQGYPLRVIASIFQHNPLVLLTRRDSGILSPYDLKGKIVAYQSGLDDAAITAMLSYAGLKADDYIHVPHDFAHKKLISGEVDAIESYITNEPFKYRKKGYDVNILNPMSYGIDLYGDNIITTDEEINNHPDRVKRFIHATIEGWKYAFAHTEEAIAAIKKLNPSLDIDSLRYEAEMTEQLVMPTVIPIGTTNQERFELISNLYLSLGMANAADLKGALKELIYNPDEKANNYQEYIYPLFGGIAFLSVIALLLYLNNKRLHFLVQKQTKELQKFAEHFQRMMEVQQNIILLTSPTHPLYANAAFFEFTGFRSMDDFFNLHESVEELFIPMDLYFHAGKVNPGENWILALAALSDNKRIVSMLDRHQIPHAFAISLTAFDTQSYILSFSDISSTMQDVIQLGKKAAHDPLTGAFNRSFMESNWNRIVQTSAHPDQVLSLMLLDIDHFKKVNDTYGHNRGDAVLKTFVTALSQSIRNEDVLIRWGGEEFILLLKVTSEEHALKIAETLREKVADTYFEEVGHITCSIGVTYYQKEASLSQTVQNADAALYQAKADGRNRVRVHASV
ncbi:MAG: ABC transporter substrate-binding protein [Sulfuricurvum sp.]|nr:ABC transporter substrate-binding protein [Sulfuricurvum sp.]